MQIPAKRRPSKQQGSGRQALKEYATLSSVGLYIVFNLWHIRWAVFGGEHERLLRHRPLECSVLATVIFLALESERRADRVQLVEIIRILVFEVFRVERATFEACVSKHLNSGTASMTNRSDNWIFSLLVEVTDSCFKGFLSFVAYVGRLGPAMAIITFVHRVHREALFRRVQNDR